MKILKSVRIWILVLAILISVWSIGYSPTKSGVVVSAIDQSSPLFGKVTAGEKISAINEQAVKTVDDIDYWNSQTGLLRLVHNGKIDLIPVDSPGLGISVNPVPSSKINFGMDLIGGTRVILEPRFEGNMSVEEKTEMVDQILSTLETRTNVYGLKEFNFRSIDDISGKTYIQIETSATSENEIEELLSRQGLFEAYVPVELAGSTFVFSGTSYVVQQDNDSLRISDQDLEVNDTVILGGVKFILREMDADGALLAAKVYEGDDVKFVHTDSQNAFVQPYLDGFRFSFGIVLGENGVEQFAKVSEKLHEIGPPGDSCYLSQPLELYLDGTLVSSLNIGCSLKGAKISNVQISGSRETQEEALGEMRRLQSILKSGAIPVKLDIIKVDRVSPSLGRVFLHDAVVAALLATLTVSLIIYARYRSWKVALPIIGISISETFIILGIASLIGWTIDLASVAGIIASVGTGVNDQIIIVDEMLGKGRLIHTTKERIKRAFFIVFGAAGTVIAAMIPLAFIGIGVMRGFAITTVIGILVGIFITRPAFAKIVEKVAG